MEKKDVIAAVSASRGWTTAEAREIVNIVLDAIKGGILQDGKVSLPDFGVFEAKEKPARMGRNPRTGEQVMIPARKQVSFKPFKALKDGLATK